MSGINYFKAWIIFFAISTILGLLAGGITGGVLGVIYGIMGKSIEDNLLLFQTIGFIAGMIVSFFVYKWSVKKYILEEIAKDVDAPAENTH